MSRKLAIACCEGLVGLPCCREWMEWMEVLGSEQWKLEILEGAVRRIPRC